MKAKLKNYKAAIIVGRFQAHRLHPGYCSIIKQSENLADSVHFIICDAYRLGTKTDPLTFKDRAQVIRSRYSKYTFKDNCYSSLRDCQTNEEWSSNLDTLVKKRYPNLKPEEITLVHSRDSFKKHYTGIYTLTELQEVPHYSSTDTRKQALNCCSHDALVRVVFDSQQPKYPVISPTVDIAILVKSPESYHILLGKKKHKTTWCLPGGFVDILDKDLNHAAAREVKEETNIDVQAKDLIFVGSSFINDWRYKGDDCVLTTLFTTVVDESVVSSLSASDDLEEVRMVDLRYAHEIGISENHIPLIAKMKEYVNNLTNI